MRLLLAEDEKELSKALTAILKHNGYSVDAVYNGKDALDYLLGGDYDCAILDIMMPLPDGISVLKGIRHEGLDLPVIMLTAKSEIDDRVFGLDSGADDYVTKPFSPSELMARVDAIYRRVEMTRGFRKNDTTGDSIVLDEFELNLRNRTLSKFGTMIELTQVEFQIIEYFFKNPNAALSRNDILKQVWGENYFGDVKIVDVNIRRLRMKIEDNPSSPTRLVTIWGLGYKWITDAN